jgi:hypothetical protein
VTDRSRDRAVPEGVRLTVQTGEFSPGWPGSRCDTPDLGDRRAVITQQQGIVGAGCSGETDRI